MAPCRSRTRPAWWGRPPSEPTSTSPASSSGMSGCRAAPGQTITVTATGVSATLYHSANANGTGILLVAPVPPFIALNLAPVPAVFGRTTTTTAFDLRSINLSEEDVAVVTFDYAANALTVPTLQYFDSAVGAYVPVAGSTLQPNSMIVDTATHTIQVIFDASSMPQLNGLTGTVFTITVAVPASNTAEAELSQVLTASARRLRSRHQQQCDGAGNGCNDAVGRALQLVGDPDRPGRRRR